MDPLPEPTESPVSSPRRLATRLTPLALLALAVAVLVVAALVLSLVEWSSQSSKANRLQGLDSLRASATKAAVSYGVDFGSYNYKNLHGPTASWTQVEDHATASFRSDYQKTSSALQPTIVAYKATASATIPVSAVSSVSSARAVVLLLLSQSITNSTQKSGPQTQQFLVVMTLLRQKGHWVIDNVQASV